MSKRFLSRNVKYIYSEIQVKERSNETVVVLFVETDEHKPLERQHISLDEARQLRADLDKLITQEDIENE